MITVVVCFNVLIALLCFYIAFRAWKLRQTLGKVADTLLTVERKAHSLLYGAPEAIVKGQCGVNYLRLQYQQLEPQLQQARQAIAMLSLGNKILRRRSVLRRQAQAKSANGTMGHRRKRGQNKGGRATTDLGKPPLIGLE